MAEYIIYKLGPFQVPGLGDPRWVRVYAPDEDRQEKAPVLYMYDGQNIYHDQPSFSGGWHLHEAVDQLGAEGVTQPVIVGVDHGGASRVHGLSPFATADSHGSLDVLLQWMQGVLMPHIASAFSVRNDPAGVAVGGSSMGGLAALYSHFRHPELFGAALAMSPSLWFADRRFYEWLKPVTLPWTSRIYLDAGQQEDGGSVIEDTQRLVAQLREKGYTDTSLRYVEDPIGTHSEGAWRGRAPEALKFLFSGTPGHPAAEAPPPEPDSQLEQLVP